VATSKGWLPPQWMVILAVALSISFLLAAPLNAISSRLYQKYQGRLQQLEKHPLHPEDRQIPVGNPRFLILGMGRIGSGAYDELAAKFDGEILGIEHKQDLVDYHKSLGRHVVQGDASDTDFWEKLEHAPNLELVLLAMPHHIGNLFAAEQLRRLDYKGKISAIVQYTEDEESLKESGVHSIYNLYEAAGAGFVDHVVNDLLPESHVAISNAEEIKNKG
ncbi:MAG: NAD-binding protein, partial [Shewanella sp.]|nr:NAD-binding protein [Shewanella sp.]